MVLVWLRAGVEVWVYTEARGAGRLVLPIFQSFPAARMTLWIMAWYAGLVTIMFTPAPGPNHSVPVALNLEAANGLRIFSTR